MITEDHLEQLALTWFQEAGWAYLPGPEIAPDAIASERADYGVVVLKARLAAAVARLNPKIPIPALRDALLPRLLSGELPIADEENILGRIV